MNLLRAFCFLFGLVVATPANDTWSWNDDRKLKGAAILLWEVELSQSFVGPWDLFATVYEPVVSIDGLPDGKYFIRIRAVGPGGLVSQTSFPVAFAVPRPAPIPPATHVRLSIQRSADGVSWTEFHSVLDPIVAGRALYKIESTLVTVVK